MQAAVLRQGLAAGLAVGMLAGPVLGGVAGASLARTSAKGLVVEAVRATDKQHSLRWTVNFSDSSFRESIHETGFAGRVDGAETIRLTTVAGHGVVNVRLVGKTAYIKGNKVGLSQYLSFKPGPASHEANHWLAMNSTNKEFAMVAGGLTVRSVASQLMLPRARYTLLATHKVKGQLATGIEEVENANYSHPKETAVMYVRATGLPVLVRTTEPAFGLSLSLVMNGWGSRVHVVAPATSVPFQISWLG